MSTPVPGIPVFYDPRMLAESSSFSPSAGKPRHVLAAWQEAQLPIRVETFAPSSEAELAFAHDPKFVHGVLAGKIPNGFGNFSPSVAQSLPYTSGAFVAAARAALNTGCACAPVSGFHHAHYDSAGGFCTFNGLVIAARKLLSHGLVDRVLILDCDMHFGDGTDAIIKRLALSDSIENLSFGRWFDRPAQAQEYLTTLRKSAARFADFDLILYQAGADVHVDDPLGGVLTTAEMIERDRIVFEGAHAASVPIAWNLAGGYQSPLEKVIDLHRNTLRECVRAYVQPTVSQAPSPKTNGLISKGVPHESHRTP